MYTHRHAFLSALFCVRSSENILVFNIFTVKTFSLNSLKFICFLFAVPFGCFFGFRLLCIEFECKPADTRMEMQICVLLAMLKWSYVLWLQTGLQFLFSTPFLICNNWVVHGQMISWSDFVAWKSFVQCEKKVCLPFYVYKGVLMSKISLLKSDNTVS